MSCNKDQQRQIRKQSLNRIRPLLNKLKYIQNIHVIWKQQNWTQWYFHKKLQKSTGSISMSRKKKLVTLEKGQPPTSWGQSIAIQWWRRGGTTDKLRKDDNHWTSVEKGHQLNIWGESINTTSKGDKTTAL